MKNKPKRHKSENTFKFQTFSERISNIDIDVFHKVIHPYEEDDTESTFYIQTLHKLNNDNFAPEYIELSKKLPNDVYSLAQLLAQKDEIMNILVKHIQSCDSEFLPPALELLVAIAKDLRKDFYPYFYPTVLRECIQLLDTRDPNQIECVFTCLAHFFKLLWSSIIKNINTILPELLPLLSDQQPGYINNFAAQSFAFVARKVRDKKQFLILSLKNIANNEDELVGVAKLFFEVIRGVSSQFHSAMEEFLTILLRELDCRKWSALLWKICDNMVTSIVNFVNIKTNVASIWISFMKVLREFYAKWNENRDEHNADNLNMILQLVKRLVSCRENILRDPEELISFMVTLGTNSGARNFVPLHTVVIEIVSCLITSGKIRHGSEIISQIATNIDNDQLMIQFTEEIITTGSYEMISMKEFLQYVDRKELNRFIMRFLAKIVWLKTRFCIEDESNLSFYSVYLKSAPEKITSFLMNAILSNIVVEDTLLSIIILSFMKYDEKTLTTRVDRFIKELCSRLRTNQYDDADKAKFLYILLVTVRYRRKCNRSIALTYDHTLINTAIQFVDSSNYICSLKLLDEVSSFSDISCLGSDENIRKLIRNLNSPFHKVRLFTLQLLTKLDENSVFALLLRIESIAPSLETYREKLQLLQKLECNEQFLDENRGNELAKMATLKFLFGNLYINFRYLWEPVQKLIVSHLENETSAWSTLEYQLREAIQCDVNSARLMENLSVDFEAEFLNEHFYDLNGVDDRPDFYNFRCLLYETLANVRNLQFANKNLIPELFLKFYSEEYKINSSEHQLFINLMTKGNESPELDESTNTSAVIDNCETIKPDKNLNRLLIIYLKLLNNTANQTSQLMKSTIFDNYFELLSNGNSEIQQLAVTYIAKTLKLVAHKDRLQLLTKENTLKDQLLNISLDFQAGLFPDKDRANFMKVVLKLIYGKGKKCSARLREAIFEFLAGCEDAEIISYFDLFFNCEQFRNTVKGGIAPTSFIREEVNFERALSPSCLMSYANTVLELFKRAGKLLKGSCLSYLLRVTFKIAASLVVYLGKREEVHPGYYGILAKIRITTFETMIYFVDNFDYNWKKDELKAMLQLFVEPYIEKIPNECLQSPNPALKLLIAFTHNPRYFPLLGVNFGELSPINTIIRLLCSDKALSNVKNAILAVIERLLTLEDAHFANFTSDLSYLAEIPLTGNQKYGKALLQPHVGVILEHLQSQLAKKYVKVDGIYMLILKSISEFALDEESSMRLLTLLMPVLRSKVTANDDVVGPLLETIINLFRTFVNCDNFENYLLQIAPLFNENVSVCTRRKLCELVAYFSEKTGTKFVDAELVQGLNAMQKRWLDQPDYAERLETLKKINKLGENDELNLYNGVFAIYNCFYMIKTEKDMALRDHSSLCLKRICPKLCRKYANKWPQLANILLNVVLLPLIKEGVQNSSNENYNFESILLLGHLVRECESAHFVFRDLLPLCDKADLENDFFENILHLQHYRRIKALKRFTEIMSTVTKQPQSYSLTFALPIVSEFLLSPKYSGEHGLINCAIEALKTICLLSPWRHYEKILREFLLEMRKNTSLRKQGIRIVSTILDAFHFDISQASAIESSKKGKKNAKLEADEMEDGQVEEAEGANNSQETQPIAKRATVLCPSDATRVYRSIKSFLVPSLDRAFMTYEESERHRKLNKKTACSGSDKEEMAVMSIPIAFAIVKLLKQLPQPLLDDYVTTVFLKLSTYLKSRLPSIRRVARETMQNILLEIGCRYFRKLLSEMMSILTKGFQIHVLVFTAHAVLEKIENGLREGDVDEFVDPILEICIVDLFGKIAEEKEVEKVSSKVPEAKGNISYNMLRILCEHVSECRILDLVLPLKEIIAAHMSSKTVNKVRRCLHYIATGLSHNKHVTCESLLEFSYGVSNDCIPQLVAERENEYVRVEAEAPVQKSDTFLIPEEPRRMVAEKRKICVRTNAHVFIGFAMELLATMLKRDTIRSSAYLPYLDPFVPLINDCLQSQHTELIVLSLKCLSKLLHRDLPSLRKNVPAVSNSVFELLGKYSTGSGTNDNIELVMAAAKVAQTLIHPRMKHEISNAQLRILLFVVEDLQKNRSHYATGFSLLNSICDRGFNVPELHQLMKSTAESSIKSYYDEIRLCARKAFYQYFIKYPLGKKLREYVLFYSSQLKYEELTGRVSALEMLRVLIRKFSTMNETDGGGGNSKDGEDVKKILRELSPVLYVQLAFRLVQDNAPECKKMAAECISDILTFVRGTKEEDELFSITVIWLKERKACHRRLAVQLLAVFARTYKEKFASKLDAVLPSMADQLRDGDGSDEPGKFVRVATQTESEEAKVEKDRLVFQVLQFYVTLLESYPAFLANESYVDDVRRIGESCQLMLRHPHEWVRVEAVKILAIIFKSMDPSEIASIINGKLPYKEALLKNEQCREQIQTLCLDLCDQFAPGVEVMEALLKGAAMNLRFLAEVVQNVKRAEDKLSVRWLANKVAKQIRIEVARTPQNYAVRTIAYTWFAALAVKLQRDKVSKLLPVVLQSVMRELSTTDQQGVEIRRKAKEALGYYRQRTDANKYDEMVTKAQRLLDIKRVRRKTQNARMAVVDPERAARRKIKMRLKRKSQRIKRLEKLRKRKFKSGRRKPVEIKND